MDTVSEANYPVNFVESEQIDSLLFEDPWRVYALLFESKGISLEMCESTEYKGDLHPTKRCISRMEIALFLFNNVQ